MSFCILAFPRTWERELSQHIWHCGPWHDDASIRNHFGTNLFVKPPVCCGQRASVVGMPTASSFSKELRAQQKAMDHVAWNNKLLNRAGRISRIQQMYYPVFLRHGASSPIPPLVYFPTSRTEWDNSYKAWRDAIILLSLQCPEDPCARPAKKREYELHARLVSPQELGLLCGPRAWVSCRIRLPRSPPDRCSMPRASTWMKNQLRRAFSKALSLARLWGL